MDTPPYDFICKTVGRLLLESTHQLEQLTLQYQQKIGELQQKHAQELQKLRESEAHGLRPA